MEKVTIFHARPYQITDNKGVEHKGVSYSAWRSDGAAIQFSSEIDLEKQIFKAMKFDPNHYEEVNLIPKIDVLSGRVKWQEKPEEEELE